MEAFSPIEIIHLPPSFQVVLLILGGFSICWLPYFIVACVQIFSLIDYNSPILYKSAFSLAMANSGMNPLIYAWKNKNFRRAFALLLRCKNPDTAYRDDCINNNATSSPAKKPARPVTGSTANGSNGDRASKNSPNSSLGSSRSNMNKPSSNSHSITVDEVHVIATITGRLANAARDDEDQADSGFISGGSSDCPTTSDVVNAIEAAASATSSTTTTSASSSIGGGGADVIDDRFDFKCSF